eukprot:scpid15456/ scgid16184/ G-protein-signaling modulator 1; Activator of G-protein signaling 3
MAGIERELSAAGALDDVLAAELDQTGGGNSNGQAVADLVAEAEGCIGSGKPAKAIPVLEKALLMCNKDDAELCSVLWNMLGNVHFRLADFSKAIYCHLHDLASCREAGDGEGCTKAYANLGLAFKNAGQHEKAGQCFASQLQSCERRRHQTGMARAYNNLAQLTVMMAKLLMKECREKTAIAQGAGRDNAEAATLSKLKDSIRERLTQATAFFQNQLQIVSKQRDRLAEARAHGNIAECYELLGKYGKAIEHHTRRLTMAEDQNDHEGMSRGHCNIGNCLRSLQEYEESIEHYTKDLNISKELGDAAGQAITQRNLANTYDMMGDYNTAVRWHTDNLDLVKELGQRNEQILALGYIASLHEDMEQYDSAIEFYTKQIDIYCAAGSEEGQEQATGNVQRLHKLIQKRQEGFNASPAASPRVAHKQGIFDSARRLKEGTMRIFNRKDRRSVLAKEESPWITDMETPPMRRRQLRGTDNVYRVAQPRDGVAISAGPGAVSGIGFFNPTHGTSTFDEGKAKTDKALESVMASLSTDQPAKPSGKKASQAESNFILRAPSQEEQEKRISIYASTFGGRNHAMQLQLGVGSMLQEIAHENPLFSAFREEQGWNGVMDQSAQASMMLNSRSMDSVDVGMFEAAKGSEQPAK